VSDGSNKISIQVLFFGLTADAVGRRSLNLEVAESATAQQAIESVVKTNTKLDGQKLLFAVNQRYLPAKTILNDGDELAIFTAVSGG